MTVLDELAERIRRKDGRDEKLELLIAGLAEIVKSTSNDQNVQRLARDLRAAAPSLSGALAAAPVDAG